MEMMVIKSVVMVEVSASVVAAGVGEGIKWKWWRWWVIAAVEENKEAIGREDGGQAGGDSGCGWRHEWEGERRESEDRRKRKTGEGD